VRLTDAKHFPRFRAVCGSLPHRAPSPAEVALPPSPSARAGRLIVLLDAPAAEFGEHRQKFVAGIDAIGEEVAQPREVVMDGLDDEWPAIAVMHSLATLDRRGQAARLYSVTLLGLP
jgi:hypothetical protein